MIPFLLLDGSKILINPKFVTSLLAIPASLLPIGVLFGTYVDVVDAGEDNRFSVQGSQAVIAAALGGVPPLSVSSETYAPNLVGGAPSSPAGAWRAVRVNNLVHVIGAFFYTPTVAGVDEIVSFTLPLSMPPVGPFGFVGDLTGVAGGPGAGPTTTLVMVQPRASIGFTTGEVTVNAPAAGGLVGVAFSYSV